MTYNSIVCIGDSMTSCIWPTNTPERGLTQRLAERFPGVPIVNLGVNGDQTVQMDGRKATANQYNPYRIIVWGGTNDLYIRADLDAVIKVRLQSIYDYYGGLGYEVWAVTVPPRNNFDATHNVNLLALNAWLMALPTNVDRCIDIWGTVKGADETQLAAAYDSGDGIHLNDAAYSVLIGLV